MATATPQFGYSWDFLKKFQTGAIHNAHEWRPIRHLVEQAEQAIKPHLQECQNLEILWEKRLRPLCGDQAAIDWSKFRPLRRSREEDWSDWLAWLLETSQTGYLAHSLFGKYMECDPKTFISPNVKREKALEDRRADIVISWKTTRMTHVEVKIGDESFDKTFETAIKLRSTAPEYIWNDFILIPSQSQALWDEVADKNSNNQKVEVTAILWDDVVRGLRHCLWQEHESVFWRAWAWVFCCVIEKELLGLEKLGDDSSQPKIQMVLNWLSVLKINTEEKHE